MCNSILAWYFAPADGRLRYGDGRKIRVGVEHSVEGEIVICRNGLHGSRRIIDALKYALENTKRVYLIDRCKLIMCDSVNDGTTAGHGSIYQFCCHAGGGLALQL